MYIFSSFEHSTYLELALAALEENGIEKENILAVPISRRKPRKRLLDTIHSSDGVSFFDSGMALATAFAVLGASYGFILDWGPVVWGLIGAVSGFLIGFFIKFIIYKIKNNAQNRTGVTATETIIIVHCRPEDAQNVEQTLWDFLAMGVGKLELGEW